MEDVSRNAARYYSEQNAPDWQPTYSYWRHGGWYVDNLHYPSGAVGCIATLGKSKFMIACDPRPDAEAPRFKTREEAAYAERDLCNSRFRDMGLVGDCDCGVGADHFGHSSRCASRKVA